MAEYYPLLAKAVGSLPKSTPETRRVVYERARKALIGQLRTLHPPIPDEDIERESVELDRAIARIEEELAASPAPADAPPAVAPASEAAPPPVSPPARPARPAPPVRPAPAPRATGALGPAAKPAVPLRTKLPTRKPADAAEVPPPSDGGSPREAAPPPAKTPPIEPSPAEPPASPASDERPPLLGEDGRSAGAEGRPRPDMSRPFAPQPAAAKGPKRQMWIIWVGVGVVVAAVAAAAIKLRDRPEQTAHKVVEPQTQGDSGKIAERVGNSGSSADQGTTAASPPETPAPAATSEAAAPATSSTPNSPAPADQAAAPAPPTAANPEVPVAQRAALLVEAPNEPNKVKTYLGNVVWKLNNVSEGGPADAVGLAVEADVDLPDDKLKATITFEKNTDASLPASHTIKVRFLVQPGSPTGDVKQISVPQLRKEDSPSGDPLAGVTVPVIQNSFLVGLSPGNAETANMDLLRNLQWIDVPMLLTSGKIAKLTFEKGPAGQRDIADAIAAWQKQ